MKSVRKTIRPRKGSSKESAAIAVCTTSVLYPKGKTIKRYTKKRLTTQRRLKRGGVKPPQASMEGGILSVPDVYILLRNVQTRESLTFAADSLEANRNPAYRNMLGPLVQQLRRYAASPRVDFHRLGASSIATALEEDFMTPADRQYVRDKGVPIRGGR